MVFTNAQHLHAFVKNVVNVYYINLGVIYIDTIKGFGHFFSVALVYE